MKKSMKPSKSVRPPKHNIQSLRPLKPVRSEPKSGEVKNRQLGRTRESIEELLQEKQYTSLREWREDDKASCAWAWRQDWYEAVIIKYNLRDRVINRTREAVSKLLKKKKYKSVSEWRKDDPATCAWVYHQPWYRELLVEYGFKINKRNRTREDVEELLQEKQYNSIATWSRDNQASYRWSSQQPWFSDIINKHNLRKRKATRVKKKL